MNLLIGQIWRHTKWQLQEWLKQVGGSLVPEILLHPVDRVLGAKTSLFRAPMMSGAQTKELETFRRSLLQWDALLNLRNSVAEARASPLLPLIPSFP